MQQRKRRYTYRPERSPAYRLRSEVKPIELLNPPVDDRPMVRGRLAPPNEDAYVYVRAYDPAQAEPNRSEDGCAVHLEKLRWPRGFQCPVCFSRRQPWRHRYGRLVCQACGRTVTAKTGTLFDRSRTPLSAWYDLAQFLTAASEAFSIKRLSKAIGVSYDTTWKMVQRYRLAMRKDLETPLEGEVAVAFAHLEDLPNAPQDDPLNGPIAFIAAQTEQSGQSGVRIILMDLDNDKDTSALIRDTTTPTAKILISDYEARSLRKMGQRTIIPIPAEQRKKRHSARRVVRELKAYLQETYVGPIHMDRLQGYLDEFSMRYNHRNLPRKTSFEYLITSALKTPAINEKNL